MTVQPQNTSQRAPARRLNGNVIFFVLGLIVAIGIFLFGGSPLFAALFGAISLYGMYRFGSDDRSEEASAGDQPEHRVGNVRAEDRNDTLAEMFRREEAMHLDPEYRFLSTNIHHPGRYRSSQSDPFD